MLLIERGELTQVALDRAVRLQSESGERLSAVLTKLGLISERALAEAFAAVLDVQIVSAADFPDTPVLDGRISRKFLKQARAIPLEDRPDALNFYIGHELGHLRQNHQTWSTVLAPALFPATDRRGLLAGARVHLRPPWPRRL